MDKPGKTQKEVTKTESFEMLETTIEEIESLARAFEIISEVCTEAAAEDISFEGCSNRFFFN